MSVQVLSLPTYRTLLPLASGKVSVLEPVPALSQLILPAPVAASTSSLNLIPVLTVTVPVPLKITHVLPVNLYGVLAVAASSPLDGGMASVGAGETRLPLRSTVP